MFDELRKKLSNAVKGFIKREEKEEPKEDVEEREEPEENKLEEESREEPEQKLEEDGQIVEEAEEKNEPIEDARLEKTKEDIAENHEKPVKEKREKVQKDSGPIKLSLKTKIKSAFVGTIRLSDTEIDNFLETLRISMLESDVSYNAADLFINDLHSKLKDQRIESRRIRESIIESVRSSLFSVLYSGSAVNIDEFMEMRKRSGELPVKILFLGPNGAGKTTTIAKIANHFKSKNISNVLSASDTFRAAAIEQIEHHAKKIGVPVIKSSYGADPASIAFDAIAYARAHGIDLVLIDSAGRQETNKSLINEIQKMVRVAKPDITVFVGESTSGNQIAEQILEFNKFVKIDGIILTKLDCDAKGGGALSISNTTGIPVLFFGIGESYDALMPYDPNYIVDAIVPAGG